MPHWTQTPEGREKMSKALKKYHRERKKQGKPIRRPPRSRRNLPVPATDHVQETKQSQIDLLAAATFGQVITIIDQNARGARIASAVLAERVSELLRRETGR